MAITASGIGSGLDVNGIVSQLMSLERRPLYALQDRESEFKAQLSAYGQLKSSLSTFQDAMKDLGSLDKFQVYSATSSDEAVLTATADSAAAAGIYSLDVTRLAQNHKMGSNEFADTATFGGTAGDALSLTVGTNAMAVDLSTAQTLTQIRDAINGDTGNPGVTATILNTGAGQRLILTADESGYDSRVQLSYGGTINAATFNFTTTNQDGAGAPLGSIAELDAAYSVDGFALTSATNKISGVIDGITLELKQTGSADLTLTRDTAKIQESAQAFVDAYNEVQGTLNSLRSNRLQGEGILRSIQSQLQSVISTPPVGLTGSYSALFEVGITTDPKTGELNFNTTDFEKALDADFSGVSELFAHDDQGVAFRFGAVTDALLASDGLIDTREDGLNGRISDLQDNQRDMEYRLELKEKSLRSQYTALDSLVGKLNSTSQFLYQQLNMGQ